MQRRFVRFSLSTEVKQFCFFTSPYLTLPYLTLLHLTLLHLTLLHLTLPYLTLPYLTLPYLTLPYLTLPYLTLPTSRYLTLPNLSANVISDMCCLYRALADDDCRYHLLEVPLSSDGCQTLYPYFCVYVCMCVCE